mmetsp:Transcript_880/g.2115  ORF Transcript_880/g.2115 Transcript_880/m.2115 type:complete len:235 (-) Transcript_880:111-815(-)
MAPCLFIDDWTGLGRQKSGDFASGATAFGRAGSGLAPYKPSRNGSGQVLGGSSSSIARGALRCYGQTRTDHCLAISEGPSPVSEERARHQRKNSLSSAIENLDLDKAFPQKDSKEFTRDTSTASIQSPFLTETEGSKESLSKTARERIEYNSKRKGITFNQRKHMSPSYLRRLARRREGKQEEESSPKENQVPSYVNKAVLKSCSHTLKSQVEILARPVSNNANKSYAAVSKPC